MENVVGEMKFDPKYRALFILERENIAYIGVHLSKNKNKLLIISLDESEIVHELDLPYYPWTGLIVESSSPSLVIGARNGFLLKYDIHSKSSEPTLTQCIDLK